MADGGMDGGGLDDLSDGVSKLAEFSTVLSSVTRTLDKNVRRLESEFGKANVAIKEIKVLVEEQAGTVSRLKEESDQQKLCLEDAVSTTVDAGLPVPPSKFLSNELDTKIRLEQVGANADAWSKMKQLCDTPSRVSLDQAVNDAVHLLNSRLLEERRHLEKGAVGSKKRITKTSTTAEAIGALVMRVYEAENAMAVQSSINEALVKALRDETYLRNSHNHVTTVCADLDATMKNMLAEAGKLQKTVAEMQLGIDVLQQTLEKTRVATSEVARGGRLRIDMRKARLVDQQHDDEPEDEFIEWGLDAWTLQESDLLLKKVRDIEHRLFGSTGLEARVANIDMSVDDINSQLVNVHEQQTEMKEWQEQNSNQMNVKIAQLKVRWAAILSDTTFGLDQYSSEHDRIGNNDDAEDREEPIFIEKLGNLCDSIEGCMGAFAPMRTPDETLDYLCPQLDVVTMQAEELLRMDLEARVAAMEAKEDDPDPTPLTFADIKSLNPAYTLKDALVEACTASIAIIDERVPKVHMRRRIDKLEASAVAKDDFDRLRRGLDILKKSLDKKADLRELLERLKKKASLDDLKRAKQSGGFGNGGGGSKNHTPSHSPTHSVHEESSVESYEDSTEEKWMDNMDADAARRGNGGEGGYYDDFNDDERGGGRGGGGGGRGGRGGGGRGGGRGMGMGMGMGSLGAGLGGANTVTVDAASAAALYEVTTRVDMVAKQLRDIQDALAGTVPREEVHEALQAVLHEIKLVKMNSINVNRFKQGMDSKADAEEVRKLVDTLNEAVGDMMGTNVTAAGKAKCLLCDKPVGSVAKPSQYKERRDPRDASPARPSNQLGDAGQSSVDESLGSIGTRPSSVPRLNASSSLSRLPQEKLARITTELAVVRSTIDLPLVDQAGSSPSKLKSKVEARVRGGGGGGFGAQQENHR